MDLGRLEEGEVGRRSEGGGLWVDEVKEVGWAKSKERAQPKGKKEMGPKNKAHSHLINNLIMKIKYNN